MTNCVLCDSPIRKSFQTNDKKNYHECSSCGLIFLDCNDRLSYEDEKARYESHQNSPTDISYRNFLNQLFQPLSQRINKDNIGIFVNYKSKEKILKKRLIKSCLLQM